MCASMCVFDVCGKKHGGVDIFMCMCSCECIV